MEENQPFKVFANCMAIKGYFRSMILDVQRNNFTFIPNALYEIINSHEGKSIKDIKHQFINYKNSSNFIDEYFAFLEKNELIFFTKIPESFPKIDLTWDFPAHITNCIFDIDINSIINWNSIIKELELLICRFIQLRIFKSIHISELYEVLDYFDGSLIESIEIFLIYPSNIKSKDLTSLKLKFLRVKAIHIFDNNISYLDGDEIYYHKTAETLLSIKDCGKVNINYFCFNLPLFTEAHHHNTCLNRKISIDAEGNIRNCPSMPQSFGNIKDTTLEEALSHPDFKKYWNHKKDDIEVCKDCEFRYICTDCRAYLEDPHNEYSKPLKCGYDPYTGEWSEWSTNPLKQAAVQYYGMEDLVKK